LVDELSVDERHFDEDEQRFFLAEDSLSPIELAGADLDEPADAAPPNLVDSPRRRRFGRYVGAVVMLAAGVCVAAFTGQASRPVAAASAIPAPRPAAAAPEVAAPSPPVAFTAERAPAVLDPAAALDARERARSALSKGDVVSAVRLGTQSVELDPSDAEAWLVLGAAEMARGERGQALSTFRACTKLATRGPRHECGQMLQ